MSETLNDDGWIARRLAARDADLASGELVLAGPALTPDTEGDRLDMALALGEAASTDEERARLSEALLAGGTA